jgi:type II secretory pathway component GspD/PulD (secretin)
MIVQNGQTAVLGGLKQETDSITTNKVPLLGDIPILGYAMKNRVTSYNHNSLIIFITPRIVQDFERTESYVSEYLKARSNRLTDEVEELTGERFIPPEPEEEAAPAVAPAAGAE